MSRRATNADDESAGIYFDYEPVDPNAGEDKEYELERTEFDWVKAARGSAKQYRKQPTDKPRSKPSKHKRKQHQSNSAAPQHQPAATVNKQPSQQKAPSSTDSTTRSTTPSASAAPKPKSASKPPAADEDLPDNLSKAEYIALKKSKMMQRMKGKSTDAPASPPSPPSQLTRPKQPTSSQPSDAAQATLPSKDSPAPKAAAAGALAAGAAALAASAAAPPSDANWDQQLDQLDAEKSALEQQLDAAASNTSNSDAASFLKNLLFAADEDVEDELEGIDFSDDASIAKLFEQDSQQDKQMMLWMQQLQKDFASASAAEEAASSNGNGVHADDAADGDDDEEAALVEQLLAEMEKMMSSDQLLQQMAAAQELSKEAQQSKVAASDEALKQQLKKYDVDEQALQALLSDDPELDDLLAGISDDDDDQLGVDGMGGDEEDDIRELMKDPAEIRKILEQGDEWAAMLKQLEARDDLDDDDEEGDDTELTQWESQLQDLQRRQLGSTSSAADADAAADEDEFSFEDFMDALDSDPDLDENEKLKARLAVQGMYNASSESISGGKSGKEGAAEVYDPRLRGVTTTGLAGLVGKEEGQAELKPRPQRPQGQ